MAKRLTRTPETLAGGDGASQDGPDADRLYDEALEKLDEAVKACPTRSGRRSCGDIELVREIARAFGRPRDDDDPEEADGEPLAKRISCPNPPKSTPSGEE